MKKPWLASLLNVIPGLGYIYLNRKRAFAWWLIVSDVFGLISMFSPTTYGGADATLTLWDLAAILGGILLIVAFMVDVHAEAQKLNAKIHKAPDIR